MSAAHVYCLKGPKGQLYPATCSADRGYTWQRAFLMIPMPMKNGGDLDTCADMNGWSHRQTIGRAREIGWRVVRVTLREA